MGYCERGIETSVSLKTRNTEHYVVAWLPCSTASQPNVCRCFLDFFKEHSKQAISAVALLTWIREEPYSNLDNYQTRQITFLVVFLGVSDRIQAMSLSFQIPTHILTTYSVQCRKTVYESVKDRNLKSFITVTLFEHFKNRYIFYHYKCSIVPNIYELFCKN